MYMYTVAAATAIAVLVVGFALLHHSPGTASVEKKFIIRKVAWIKIQHRKYRILLLQTLVIITEQMKMVLMRAMVTNLIAQRSTVDKPQK